MEMKSTASLPLFGTVHQLYFSWSWTRWASAKNNGYDEKQKSTSITHQTNELISMLEYT